ncbi:MAG: hypothetical protein ACFE0O_05255 [Opitutales bacterium]
MVWFCFNRFLHAVGLVCLATLATQSAMAKTGAHPDRAGTLAVPELQEASGLIVLEGRRGQPVLVAHNDDDDTRLYRLDAGGAAYGTWQLEGVRNRDWEAMTLIRRGYPHVEGALLVVGDIGDNAGVYRKINLLIFRLPESPPDAPGNVKLPLLDRLAITYPEGPRDAESLAWDPSDRCFYLLSKREFPARWYRIRPRPPGGTGVVEATLLGDVSTLPQPRPVDWKEQRFLRWSGQATDMAVNPDGSRLAILTYKDPVLYERQPGEAWLEALRRSPRVLDTVQLPQAEALAWGPGGEALFILSEGTGTPVLRVVPPRRGTP